MILTEERMTALAGGWEDSRAPKTELAQSSCSSVGEATPARPMVLNVVSDRVLEAYWQALGPPSAALARPLPPRRSANLNHHQVSVRADGVQGGRDHRLESDSTVAS